MVCMITIWFLKMKVMKCDTRVKEEYMNEPISNLSERDSDNRMIKK